MLLTKLSQEEKNILPFQKQWEIVLRKNNVFNKLKAVITKLENKIEKKRSTRRARKEKNELSQYCLTVKRIWRWSNHLIKGYFHCLTKKTRKTSKCGFRKKIKDLEIKYNIICCYSGNVINFKKVKKMRLIHLSFWRLECVTLHVRNRFGRSFLSKIKSWSQ